MPGFRTFLFLCFSFLSVMPGLAHSEEPLFKENGSGIPIAKNFELLCQGNALSQNHEEIVWEMYSSKSSPAEVVAGYQKKLGKQNFTAEGEGGTWKLSESSRISISSADKKPPLSSCKEDPPKDAKTLVLTSVFFKPSQNK